MNGTSSRRRRGAAGFTFVEVLCALAVVSVLLTLGFGQLRTARRAARVVDAENRLRQVATGLELYYGQFLTYPPEGSDLSVVLAPFVPNPNVFTNPLRADDQPGRDLSAHYKKPSLENLDRPGIYVACFTPGCGDDPIVVLESNGRVTNHAHPGLDVEHTQINSLIACLYPSQTIVDGPSAAAALEPPPALPGELPLTPSMDATPAEPSAPLGGFEKVPGGGIVTRVCSDLLIHCVGSQFGYADGTLIPITASAKIDDPKVTNDGAWADLFGGQPIHGGEEIRNDTVNAGTTVTLKGEITGSYERWLWTRYGYPLSYTSDDLSRQVRTYKRGDAPPDFAPGYPCQASAGDLVAPYIDPQTGVVTIAENQVICLWDFNPLFTNAGIDFQDLIILATATAAERECLDAGVAP
jgi:prepilin-type N-terminal cleavage/methylation domain-containing protein